MFDATEPWNVMTCTETTLPSSARRIAAAAAIAVATSVWPAGHADASQPSDGASAAETAPAVDRALAEPSLAAGAAAAGTAGAPRLDSADALAAAVRESNPDLAAIEYRIAALEHAVPQAGVWPDPMASVEDSNVPLAEPYPGGHPMAGVQFRLQQTFPFPGKTAARTAVARSRVATGRAQLAERLDQLTGKVRDGYHQLALVRQLREVTANHIGLVTELIGAVRARYETGNAPQHDLLDLQVLKDRLTDDLADFTRQDREITAALLAAVHLPPDTYIATPAETPLPPPPTVLAPLVERADRSRPLLHVLSTEAETAKLAAREAEVEKRPDLTLWLGYRWREPVGADTGVDLYTAGVSIPLPWLWNGRRWGERAAEQRARARSFEEDRAARLDQIRGDIDAALARWRRAEEKAHVYETGLLPDERRTLESTLASYRVGKAEFATLYRVELQLLEFERAIRTAHAEAARAAVNVATLTGEFAGEAAEGAKK